MFNNYAQVFLLFVIYKIINTTYTEYQEALISL